MWTNALNQSVEIRVGDLLLLQPKSSRISRSPNCDYQYNMYLIVKIEDTHVIAARFNPRHKFRNPRNPAILERYLYSKFAIEIIDKVFVQIHC
jgi:hypothetical protein